MATRWSCKEVRHGKKNRRCVTFGKTAENCSQYLSKGSLVYVDGKLRTRKWQDQSGQDRYSTEVNADRVQFLDRKDSA